MKMRKSMMLVVKEIKEKWSKSVEMVKKRKWVVKEEWKLEMDVDKKVWMMENEVGKWKGYFERWYFEKKKGMWVKFG